MPPHLAQPCYVALGLALIWGFLNRRPTVYQSNSLPMRYLGWVKFECCFIQMFSLILDPLNVPIHQLKHWAYKFLSMYIDVLLIPISIQYFLNCFSFLPIISFQTFISLQIKLWHLFFLAVIFFTMISCMSKYVI